MRFKTIIGILLMIIMILLTHIFVSKAKGVSLNFPIQYNKAEFRCYVLTDIGTFAIYKAHVVRLNLEWQKRQSTRSFHVSAFTDIQRKEIWHCTEEGLEAELKNIESWRTYNKAIMKDIYYEAEHRAQQLQHWLRYGLSGVRRIR